jgi:tetratricopeptide (TPR) repeat protein
MLREALAAARAAKDRLLIGRALNNLGLAAIEAGRYEEALEHLREAAAAREGLDYSRGHAINLHNIGDCHLRLGDRARAHVAFTRSLEVARRMGWDRGVVLNDLHLAFLDGDVPRIDALIRRANLLSDPSLACAGGLLAAKVLAASERAADAVSRLRAVEEQATRCNLTAVAHQAAALRRPLEEGA